MERSMEGIRSGMGLDCADFSRDFFAQTFLKTLILHCKGGIFSGEKQCTRFISESLRAVRMDAEHKRVCLFLRHEQPQKKMGRSEKS